MNLKGIPPMVSGIFFRVHILYLTITEFEKIRLFIRILTIE